MKYKTQRLFFTILIISFTSLIGKPREVEDVFYELVKSEVFLEYVSNDSGKIKINTPDYRFYQNSSNFVFVYNQSEYDIELRFMIKYCKNIYILEFFKDDILRVIMTFDEKEKKWVVFRLEVIGPENPLVNTTKFYLYESIP